ncbi:MAG TPA: hypothetical protein VEK79_10775 [Thermoanaerobaculia bacterium]|nr:hypothetical protein [Thermoanaerobaculia bacterium]
MIRSLTLAVIFALTTTALAQTAALTFTLGPIERIEHSDILRTFAVVHNSDPDIHRPIVEIGIIGDRTVYLGGQNDAHWTCANGATPYELICSTPRIRAGESLPLQIYAGPLRHGRLQIYGRVEWQMFEALSSRRSRDSTADSRATSS